MIVGALHLDLSHVEELGYPQRLNEDRKILDQLDRVPDGVKVTVYVGSRRFLGVGAMDYIHNNGQRLHIEIVGTEVTDVAALVRMTRSGPSEVA